jgi:hypothetical protein
MDRRDKHAFTTIKGLCFLCGRSRGIILKETGVTSQAALHNRLFYLARSRYDCFEEWLTHYKLSFYGAILTYYKNPKYEDYIEIYFEGDFDVTFKVALKCRKELAPVELLVELLKEQSYESVPGSHTSQDRRPDLEMKIEILKGRCLMYPRQCVFKGLIRYGNKQSKWFQWLCSLRKLFKSLCV